MDFRTDFLEGKAKHSKLVIWIIPSVHENSLDGEGIDTPDMQ